MEIQYTIYPDGEIHSFYARGHHPSAEFIAVFLSLNLFEEFGYEHEEDILIEEILHQHWRKVPDHTGDLAWRAVVSEPGPGAFPVTVLYP